MKPTLEYVYSAVEQGFYLVDKIPSTELVEGTLNLQKIFDKDVTEACKNYTPQTSILYNAFTEKKLIEKFKGYKNLGMRSVYADSGGLQMVTKGIDLTKEARAQIYPAQEYADVAMCFDAMPLSQANDKKKRTRNERSNMDSRIYHPSLTWDAGIQTGKNVHQQIRIFREHEAKTKVIIIVQGNCAKDMVEYYTALTSQLKEGDYDHIGGLAISGACIGKGELEAIEIIRAAHLIGKLGHGNITRHFHLLGIGSIARMKPVIYLIKTGYLKFDHISYDSTSHTSAFTYGLVKLNGGCKPLGKNREPKNVAYFRSVYELFKPYLITKATENEFLDIILGHNEAMELGKSLDWKRSSIVKRGNDHIVAKLAVNVHTMFQVNNFIKCLDKVWDDKFDGSAISGLHNVKDDDDMQYWFEQFSDKVTTKRVARKPTSLQGFL
jgi:hypothetical protein